MVLASLRITAPIWIGHPKIETPDVLARSKTVTVRAEINNLEGKPLSGTLTVYGGLDCKQGWAYVGATKRSTLTAAADATRARAPG